MTRRYPARSLAAALATLLTTALGLVDAMRASVAPASSPGHVFGAQDPVPARIPVRIVQGRLVVAAEVATRHRRLPLQLFCEYDSPCGLQLHNQVARGLRAESEDGSSIPIAVSLGGGAFEFEVARREHGDEDAYDDFTRYHSIELGEQPVAGTIGAEIFADYYVEFDLANGFLYLGAPRAESATARDQVEGALVVPLTEAGGLAWLPVRYADGSPAALAIGGARYDTTIDFAVCDRFARPAGNLEALRIDRELDLTEFVALRPAEVVLAHPDGVAGVLGLNVLEHFRVEIDRVNRVARWRQTAPALYPAADLQFFRAIADEDPDALSAFLREHKDSRLAREAADTLLRWRLESSADAADCRLAIQAVHDSHPVDLRATAMLDLAKQLREAALPDLAVLACEIGVPAGREDRYPDTVHRLHATAGQLLLDRGERTAAWEHLLSAAFGLPEDGLINYDLGRFYEAEGRLRRAYSRYVQAVIKPDSGPQALTALHRLQGHDGGAARMSVDEIERLTAGKTHAFGAATKYRPEPGAAAGRVVLVEFFTNANYGDAERGGAIGGALGNDGLVSHFGAEHVAFITHHLPVPELVPMSTEFGERTAADYGLRRPEVHIINGTRRGPGAGRWRDKEQIYDECRRAIVSELAVPSPYTMRVSAELHGDRLRGELFANGPTDADLRLQVVLVERGVLYPGRSEIVIHRNVARAQLTEGAGVTWSPDPDVGMRVPFDVSLDAVRAANERYLDDAMARGASAVTKISMDIDPAQISVVGFLRDRRSNAVRQAVRFDLGKSAVEDSK